MNRVMPDRVTSPILVMFLVMRLTRGTPGHGGATVVGAHGGKLRGAFASSDGSIDYRQNLRHVHTPVLAVAGACDRLAPPENVAIAHDLLASARKRLVVLGKAQHFSADYGHVDSVFGRQAPDEVYPLIADWVGDTLAAAPV